jgi:hypothetical protein
VKRAVATLAIGLLPRLAAAQAAPAEPPPVAETAPAADADHGAVHTPDNESPAAPSPGAGDADGAGSGGGEALVGTDQPRATKERAEGAPIQVSGRVVVREELASADGANWTGLAALEDVRLEATYRHRKRLEIVVELAAKSDAEIRDAYVRLKVGPDLRLQAGHFKLPVSAAELTSKWKLPTADRGLLSDILDDGLGIAGRRTGATLTWSPDGALRPRLVLGGFGGRDAAGDDTPGLLADDQAGLTAVGRAEIAPLGGLTLGVHASSRLGTRSGETDRDRLWAAGLDGELAIGVAGGGLRLWADLIAGSSVLDTTPATTAAPLFVAARATVGWHRAAGGVADVGDLYVEPFAMGSLIDVNLDNSDDLAWEAAAGVSAGHWRRWRAQLQIERRRVAADAPAALAGGLTAPADRDAVIVQLGAAF